MLKLKEKDKEILKEIKKTILEVAKEQGIEIDRIILFGSRARGDYREDSDWDILVVTKNKLNKEKFIELFVGIRLKLAKKKIKNDLLVFSRQDYVSRLTMDLFLNEIDQEGVML